MQISLIITTFNWPQALDLVLTSVAGQTLNPDEIIIADDGSGEETARLVASWVGRLGVPLHHLWQEHRGFRAGRSRNRAIAAARGDYLILLDGDMVVDEHFVADHAEARKPGCFVQGMRIATDAARAEKMIKHRLTAVGPLTPGVRRPYLAFRSPWLSRRLSRSNVTMSRIKSCNQGHWRASLIAVNGFNERMVGWGAEDKECVARLENLGVQGIQLRFAAKATHLYHPSRAPIGANPNDAVLAATIASRITRCEAGLDQYLAEFAEGIPAAATPPFGTAAQKWRVSEMVAR